MKEPRHVRSPGMFAAQDGDCGRGDTQRKYPQQLPRELGAGVGLVPPVSEAIQDGDRYHCWLKGRCRINPTGLPGSQAEGTRGRSDLLLIQAKEGSVPLSASPRMPRLKVLLHSGTVVKPLC